MNDTSTTQFKTEGQPAFPVANRDDDTSSDSSSVNDTNTDTTTDSSDQDQTQTDDKSGGSKDDNFADHPRWKERESDWTKRFNDQEQRHVNEIAKLREDLTKQFGGNANVNGNDGNSAPVEVPSWFGGDEAQWKEFMGWNQSLIAKAKEEARTEALNEIENKSKSEQKAIEDATNYFNEQVTAIESDKELNPQGVKVDRNKLLKFVLDNDVVDSKGRWNYRAGFLMMKSAPNAAIKKDTDQRKQIAGATTSENRSETKAPNFTTSEDFSNPSNRPW